MVTATVSVFDSVFSLFAASCAASVGTLIFTSPLVVGVISTVYSVPLTAVKSVAAAVAVLSASEMSPCTKSVTVSLKVIVMLNALVCVPEGPVRVILGFTVSNCTRCSTEAVLPVLAAFCAAPAGTEMIISSATFISGVMVAVYEVPPSVKLTVALTLPPSEISLASKPVTVSENSMVISNALFFGFIGTPVIVTVGAGRLTVTVWDSDSVFLLPAASSATSVFTLIFTLPLVVGVISAVYSAPLTVVKSVTVAVAVLSVSEMSSCTKSVTVSLKVIVMLNALVCVPEGPVRVILGFTVSNCTRCSTEAVLPVLAAFCVTPAGTEMTISSTTFIAGVMVAVYCVSLPCTAVKLTVALTFSPNEISLTSKPVTVSENSMVISNALFVGLVGTPVIVTVGAGRLTVTVWDSDSVFLLPAASSATSVFTLIFTLPLVVGVISAVYSAPLTVVKSVTVAVAVLSVSEMSSCTKSVTVSLKVIVILNAPVCVPDGTVTVTAGSFQSTETVCWFDSVFKLPALSFAKLAGTFSITLPSLPSTRERVAVWVLPLPLKLYI